jgi:peptidyl-prolyl cis-trans isomerase D
MIEAMRSKAASWVVKILAVFLILSFAVWGIGDMFRGRGILQTVAEVGDTEIPSQDLNDQFRRIVNAMRTRLGSNFDTRQAVQLGLLDQTLDHLIGSRLLSLEAKRLGLAAGDSLVRTTIRNAPEFRNESNIFDPIRFREVLSAEGFGSEGAYVEHLRNEIMRRQITGAITAGVTPPAPLLDVVYGYRNEQRVVELVPVPAGRADALPDPDEAALAAFHKKNPALFTAPEYRRIVALQLDPAEVAATIEPPEKRLRDEFEFRRRALSVPERRELQQVLVQDEAVARKIAAALQEGQSLEKAAQDVAKAKPSDLGKLRRTDLTPALAEAAFALPRDGVSAPVNDPLGWHLIRVVSIEPGREPTFDELRQKIRDDMARDLAIDILNKQTNQIEDALAGGATIEETAVKVGARPIRIPAMDVQGRDSGGRKVSGIPKDPKFIEVAFATPAGQVTTLEETADGGFFVLRVDSVTAPALKPLAAVRTEAVSAWKRQQLLDATRKRAEAVRTDASGLGGIDKAAARHGLKAVTSKPFTRFVRDPSSPVSDALAAEAFRAKPGDIMLAPGPDGYLVGQLRQVIAAEPGKNAEEARLLRTQLANALAQDIAGQYLAALKQRYPVTIIRAAVDSIVAGGG